MSEAEVARKNLPWWVNWSQKKRGAEGEKKTNQTNKPKKKKRHYAFPQSSTWKRKNPRPNQKSIPRGMQDMRLRRNKSHYHQWKELFSFPLSPSALGALQSKKMKEAMYL